MYLVGVDLHSLSLGLDGEGELAAITLEALRVLWLGVN